MRAALFAAAAVTLSACGTFQSESRQGFTQNDGWTTGATYTTADVRIVTERPHPLDPAKRVICTEPAADVAKALSSALQAQAQGGNGATNAGLGFGASSAEAAMELAGRSTALLGLRDGLYRACEAYANGAIGADAYALVLSRYGQLMATLFLSEDISAAAASTGRTTINSPAATINLPALPSGGGTPQKGAATQDNTQNKGGQGAAAESDAPLLASTARPGADPSLMRLATAVPAVLDYSPRPQFQLAKTESSGAGAGTGGNTQQAEPGSDKPQTATAQAASAIQQIHKGYLDLDNSETLSHVLMVACINDGDPTVAARTFDSVNDRPNTFLKPLCDKFAALLPDLLKGQAKSAQERGTVNPRITAVQIAAAQTALHRMGFDPGKIDGKLGLRTMQAALRFQQANNLPITGMLDGDTLRRLGVSI